MNIIGLPAVGTSTYDIPKLTGINLDQGKLVSENIEQQYLTNSKAQTAKSLSYRYVIVIMIYLHH